MSVSSAFLAQHRANVKITYPVLGAEPGFVFILEAKYDSDTVDAYGEACLLFNVETYFLTNVPDPTHVKAGIGRLRTHFNSFQFVSKTETSGLIRGLKSRVLEFGIPVDESGVSVTSESISRAPEDDSALVFFQPKLIPDLSIIGERNLGLNHYLSDTLVNIYSPKSIRKLRTKTVARAVTSLEFKGTLSFNVSFKKGTVKVSDATGNYGLNRHLIYKAPTLFPKFKDAVLAGCRKLISEVADLADVSVIVSVFDAGFDDFCLAISGVYASPTGNSGWSSLNTQLFADKIKSEFDYFDPLLHSEILEVISPAAVVPYEEMWQAVVEAIDTSFEEDSRLVIFNRPVTGGLVLTQAIGGCVTNGVEV